MNDPNSYQGGDFEVDAGYHDCEKRTETVKLASAGDMIIFPSLLPHRVKPVTGLRQSLVGWVVGPPYQ